MSIFSLKTNYPDEVSKKTDIFTLYNNFNNLGEFFFCDLFITSPDSKVESKNI